MVRTGNLRYKQIQTAKICLNVEKDCISIIVWAKVGPPWRQLDPLEGKSLNRPCLLFSVIFDMFDTDRQKILGHDAMYRMYKMMFGNVVSDDHILALTFSALRHPNLSKDDEVSREEFCDVC